MALDLPTLFFIAGTVEFLLGCIFIYTYRTSKIYPGFSYASVSFLARGVGYILLLIGLKYLNLYIILVANILAILSLDLMFKSMRMYIDVNLRGHYSRYVVYAIALISYSYYLFIDFNTDSRIIIMRFCAAIVSAYICFYVYKYMSAGFSRERGFILVVFGLSALIYIVTGSQKFFIHIHHSQNLPNHSDQVWGFIIFICLSIATAIAFLNLNNRNLQLEHDAAQAKVRVLSGLLPICACCKKIRDNNNNWNNMENYISDHSEAMFSHGYCPDCLEKERSKLNAYLHK